MDFLKFFQEVALKSSGSCAVPAVNPNFTFYQSLVQTASIGNQINAGFNFPHVGRIFDAAKCGDLIHLFSQKENYNIETIRTVEEKAMKINAWKSMVFAMVQGLYSILQAGYDISTLTLNEWASMDVKIGNVQAELEYSVWTYFQYTMNAFIYAVPHHGNWWFWKVYIPLNRIDVQPPSKCLELSVNKTRELLAQLQVIPADIIEYLKTDLIRSFQDDFRAEKPGDPTEEFPDKYATDMFMLIGVYNNDAVVPDARDVVKFVSGNLATYFATSQATNSFDIARKEVEWKMRNGQEGPYSIEVPILPYPDNITNEEIIRAIDHAMGRYDPLDVPVVKDRDLFIVNINTLMLVLGVHGEAEDYLNYYIKTYADTLNEESPPDPLLVDIIFKVSPRKMATFLSTLGKGFLEGSEYAFDVLQYLKKIASLNPQYAAALIPKDFKFDKSKVPHLNEIFLVNILQKPEKIIPIYFPHKLTSKAYYPATDSQIDDINYVRIPLPLTDYADQKTFLVRLNQVAPEMLQIIGFLEQVQTNMDILVHSDIFPFLIDSYAFSTIPPDFRASYNITVLGSGEEEEGVAVLKMIVPLAEKVFNAKGEEVTNTYYEFGLTPDPVNFLDQTVVINYEKSNILASLTKHVSLFQIGYAIKRGLAATPLAALCYPNRVCYKQSPLPDMTQAAFNMIADAD